MLELPLPLVRIPIHYKPFQTPLNLRTLSQITMEFCSCPHRPPLPLLRRRPSPVAFFPDRHLVARSRPGTVIGVSFPLSKGKPGRILCSYSDEISTVERIKKANDAVEAETAEEAPVVEASGDEGGGGAIDFLKDLDLKCIINAIGTETLKLIEEEVNSQNNGEVRKHIRDLMQETSEKVEVLNDVKPDTSLDTEETFNILLFGSGALVALLVTSGIVSAIDSLPVFPKAMEVVGLGFTVWFSARYLVFKSNRDELLAQIESLKEQIIGPSDN